MVTPMRMYGPAFRLSERNISGSYLSENRNKSIILINVVKDNFRIVLRKYAQRANTVISNCMPGRTSGTMEKNTYSPLRSLPPHPSPSRHSSPSLINSFTTTRYRIVFSVLYLKWALWFLLVLRLYNFISGENSNKKELSLIEKLYVRC